MLGPMLIPCMLRKAGGFFEPPPTVLALMCHLEPHSQPRPYLLGLTTFHHRRTVQNCWLESVSPHSLNRSNATTWNTNSAAIWTADFFHMCCWHVLTLQNKSCQDQELNYTDYTWFLSIGTHQSVQGSNARPKLDNKWLTSIGLILACTPLLLSSQLPFSNNSINIWSPH